MSLKIDIENLNDLLMNLESTSGIFGTCLVRNNGIIITSRLSPDIDSRKFGAMAATMFASIETATKTLENTNINSLTVEFTKEYQLIVLKAAEQILLVALIGLNVNLGLILIEIEETIKKIKETLEEWIVILTEKQKERYSRQIISPLIGEKGQEKLSQIKVLQIGAGGLGSPFSLYLAATGIKELTIIDNDTVSISNLQRQILYNETQVGESKVEMAKKALTNLNSDLQVNVYQDYIDENSIMKYIKDQDFIVDCSDNLQTKFVVNKTAIENNIKCVIAGIKDFYGQILTVDPKKSACYHCIFPELSKDSKLPNEGPLPVIGVTPGILGTLEALEVIKTTLGLPNLENKLLMVNLLDLSFNVIKVIKDENCICSN